MSKYRYINNTASDVVSSPYTVSTYSDLTITVRAPELEAYVNISLDLLIDGVATKDYVKYTQDSIGNTQQTPGVPTGVQLLYVIKGANMAITTDQAFTKAYFGTSCVPTLVVANRKTGGASVACAGGIYDTASKAGVVIASAATNWVTLSSTVPVIVDISTTLNKTLPLATPFLSLTTGSTAACTADIFVFGYVLA